MRVAVAGSIATDHLMTFPGRFTDSLVADKLDKVSLSFLVDGLSVRRGGVAANITFALGRLGLRPVLVGSAGVDFDDYERELAAAGVDCASVHRSATQHTARFVCTTDAEQNQIAAFYPGAMTEERPSELPAVADRVGGLDLVLIGPDDVATMLRHTDECRVRGYAFAADPSQQLARMEGGDIRRLVDGAAYLFCNEYESALLEQKTGWSAAEVLNRVGVRVTTQGAQGSVVERAGDAAVHVPAVPGVTPVDPTGGGDAFRAGYLAGMAWQLSPTRCAQVGSVLATYVLAAVGTQEYTFSPEQFCSRLEQAYGAEAAVDVGRHLGATAAAV